MNDTPPPGSPDPSPNPPPDPGSSEGPAAAGQPGSAGGPPNAGPPPRGMSTGTKVLLGCLGVAALGAIVAMIAVAVGGFALFRGAQSVAGNLEEQQQATEELSRLEREHPFRVPDDRVVTEAQLERFLAVTEEAWEDMEPWAEDLEDLERRGQDTGGPQGLGDVMAGARALGGMAQARLALADALSEHEMSLGEYAWTGLSLARAQDVADGSEAERAGVPAGNVELVRRRGGELPRFDDEGEGPDRTLVLVVATLWGMTEASTWQALGLDTLARNR